MPTYRPTGKPTFLNIRMTTSRKLGLYNYKLDRTEIWTSTSWVVCHYKIKIQYGVQPQSQCADYATITGRVNGRTEVLISLYTKIGLSHYVIDHYYILSADPNIMDQLSRGHDRKDQFWVQSCSLLLITAQCTLVQSAVLRSHVVHPSVCPSVTLVDCDHIGLKS